MLLASGRIASLQSVQRMPQIEFYQNALKLQKLLRSTKKLITVILQTTVRLVY